MAFQDILQALTADTDKRIAAAREAQQAVLADTRSRIESETANALGSIRTECERKKKNMERQVLAHAQMSGRQTVMAAKHALMERTYEAALEQLASLDAKRSEDLLKRLLRACPAGGTIRPAEPHAALLKKLADGREIGDSVRSRGGFVHVSDVADRDCTYETLVRDILRPATELAVAGALFPSIAA